MIVLAEVAPPLAGLPAAQQNLALLGGALLALGLAWLSSRMGSLFNAFGAAGTGAAVGAGTAWLGTQDLFTAAMAGAALFVVGAGANLFALPRPGELEVWGWSGMALAGIAGLALLAGVDVAAFALFASLILFGSFKVISTKELVHATVWLAAVLLGVAGLFVVLGMPFLGMIQVLVYVGAVITLILFTVMLTVPARESITLAPLDLPPGVTIESIEDLDPETPRYGHGPMKSFTETNPRKPVVPPETLYGVSITDNVYGTETTVRRKAQKEKEAE